MKVPASIQRPLAPPRRGGTPCYHLGGVEVGAPGLHGHPWGKHYSQTDRKSRLPPVFSDTTPWDLVGPLWVRGNVLTPLSHHEWECLCFFWDIWSTRASIVYRFSVLLGCHFFIFLTREIRFSLELFCLFSLAFLGWQFLQHSVLCIRGKNQTQGTYTCGSSDPMVPAIFSPLSESSYVCFIFSVQGF